MRDAFGAELAAGDLVAYAEAKGGRYAARGLKLGRIIEVFTDKNPKGVAEVNGPHGRRILISRELAKQPHLTAL